MLLFLFVGLPLAAQESDGDDYPYPDVREDEYKDYVKDKFHDQQDQFLDNKYMYPAPPKNQWELGIDVGGLWISGDVKSSLFPGFGIGGHVRKSFGYVFSVRGSFMTGTTKGSNWQGSSGWFVEDTRNPKKTTGRSSRTQTDLNKTTITAKKKDRKKESSKGGLFGWFRGKK